MASNGFRTILTLVLLSSFCACVEPDRVVVSGYPEAPVVATSNVYVNPAATDPAPNGTLDKPWHTISEAVFAAPEGAAILIAPGDYEEVAAETLTITRSVHLVGPPLDADGTPQVTVNGGEMAVVLKVKPAADQGSAAAAPHVTFQRIRFYGGGAANVVVDGEQDVEFQDCTFDGLGDDWDAPTDRSDGSDGPWGLVIKGESSVKIRRGKIRDAHRTGLIVQEGGLELSGTVVRDNKGGGIRLEAARNTVVIHDAHIEGNGVYGIGAFGSSLEVVGGKILANTGTQDADGIQAHPIETGSNLGTYDTIHKVLIQGATIQGNNRYGVFLKGLHSYELVRNTIKGHGTGGIRVQSLDPAQDVEPDHNETLSPATEPMIFDNTVADNSGTGIALFGLVHATLVCNDVQDISQSESIGPGEPEDGDGILVSQNAQVQVRHNAVQNWEQDRYAVLFQDAGGASCALGNGASLKEFCNQPDAKNQSVQEMWEYVDWQGKHPGASCDAKDWMPSPSDVTYKAYDLALKSDPPNGMSTPSNEPSSSPDAGPLLPPEEEDAGGQGGQGDAAGNSNQDSFAAESPLCDNPCQDDPEQCCDDASGERSPGTYAATDSDGDGYLDGVDNCPCDDNPDQSDADFDGIGDACTEEDEVPDSDGDGIPDVVDNCPCVENPYQEDLDGDGFGDACTSPGTSRPPVSPPDKDGDGITDEDDNCPDVANGDQSSTYGKSSGDACTYAENCTDGAYCDTTAPNDDDTDESEKSDLDDL